MRIREADLEDLDSNNTRGSSSTIYLFPLLARFQGLDHYARAIYPVTYALALVYHYAQLYDLPTIPADSPCVG